MKYAIYKNRIGLRAVEYADTKEAIASLPYIKEEDLPVIINRMGGYTSFKIEYEINEGFVEIIEVDEEADPLTREQMYPKNSPEFEYGWIDPDGNTYNTGYEGHSWAAEAICKELGVDTYNPERKLEDLGWIKVTGHYEDGVLKKDVLVGEKNDFFITKKQADTLFDLNLWDVGYVGFYVKHSESKW